MESPEALEAFLLWLGNNTASGARKYEEVRQRLILLFRCRGSQTPEELADETIDRTARIVTRPDFQFSGDSMAYFRGVARNVFLESLRHQRRLILEPISEMNFEPPAPNNREEDKERMAAGLEHCLDELPEGKRSLLLRYYQSEKGTKIDNRHHLAEEQGIGLNALRIQIFRLRNAVRLCVETYLRRAEMQSPGTTFHG